MCVLRAVQGYERTNGRDRGMGDLQQKSMDVGVKGGVWRNKKIWVDGGHTEGEGCGRDACGKIGGEQESGHVAWGVSGLCG